MRRRREEVFDGEEFKSAGESDDALVGGSFGEEGELLARFLADGDAGLAAEGDELFQACIVALAGHNDLAEAALTGLEGFLDRMHSVQDIHDG